MDGVDSMPSSPKIKLKGFENSVGEFLVLSEWSGDHLLYYRFIYEFPLKQ